METGLGFGTTDERWERSLSLMGLLTLISLQDYCLGIIKKKIYIYLEQPKSYLYVCAASHAIRSLSLPGNFMWS